MSLAKFTVLSAIGFGVCLLIMSACVKGTGKVVKTVLDIAEIACVLASDHVEDERALANACHIAEDKLDDVRKILSAKKEAARMKASGVGSAAPSASVSGGK